MVDDTYRVTVVFPVFRKIGDKGWYKFLPLTNVKKARSNVQHFVERTGLDFDQAAFRTARRVNGLAISSK